MIRTPQEFINEVRARFSERLNDEIEEHGKTVMHFAEENNRLRAERDRLRDIVRTVRDTIELQATFDDKGGFHLDNVPACVIAKALFSEARAIGEDAK